MVDDQVHEAVVDDLRVSQQRIKELTRERNELLALLEDYDFAFAKQALHHPHMGNPLLEKHKALLSRLRGEGGE